MEEEDNNDDSSSGSGSSSAGTVVIEEVNNLVAALANVSLAQRSDKAEQRVAVSMENLPGTMKAAEENAAWVAESRKTLAGMLLKLHASRNDLSSNAAFVQEQLEGAGLLGDEPAGVGKVKSGMNQRGSDKEFFVEKLAMWMVHKECLVRGGWWHEFLRSKHWRELESEEEHDRELPEGERLSDETTSYRRLRDMTFVATFPFNKEVIWGLEALWSMFGPTHNSSDLEDRATTKLFMMDETLGLCDLTTKQLERMEVNLRTILGNKAREVPFRKLITFGHYVFL